jgi:hypothetical protein
MVDGKQLKTNPDVQHNIRNNTFSLKIFRRETVHISGDISKILDRFCGLVVRVPCCRSRGPGSIPGVTKFSQK